MTRHLSFSIRGYLCHVVLAFTLLTPTSVAGQAVSEAPILQLFEARWDTIESRMPDVFGVGYGGMWVPPPGRAGSGFSVGYDVFDRFDLGTPRNETHYGTESSFRQMTSQANLASVGVYPDLIINHNGFGNRTDANFVSQGGYPGFALTLPSDINGDFHDPFISIGDNSLTGQLSGLNDIAQEKDYQFIRHPTDASNPNNIPAGTLFNQPNASNTRFYPDRNLSGTAVSDPRLGQNVTLYDFNSSDNSAGDPITENALGLLMRNARWMVQEFGVKGFRVDAAKHVPQFTHEYLDQAVFRAIQDLQHDGSFQPTYMFGEVFDGTQSFVQQYIRRDLPNRYSIDAANTTVGGNRDALDFPLAFALRDNLTGNGLANNWHHIRGASQDSHDRPAGSELWHTDGSQGVAFVSSHDETGPFLENVAYAYTLMRPGNAVVYMNAEQFGPSGTFPQPGKVDALGGFYGETITKLVDIRNSHGRGDFIERWLDDAFNPEGFSNVYVYERQNAAVVGLSSRNDGFVESRSGVSTGFAPGTVLVELTGNAADPSVDPGGNVPETIRVGASGAIDISIPGNDPSGRGYVVYGVATPQGTLSLTNVASTLQGATPTGGNFGTARLSDIDVISADSFDVQLATNPVTLAAPAGESEPIRDVHADGDQALLRIDQGLDLNDNGLVDNTSPGAVSYGFEAFTGVNSPGYVWDGSQNIGTGSGSYAQTIDASSLSEGRHFITVRAFRHRDAASGGDGGPAVFTDFRRTVYIDRLPPESEVLSFEPFASDPGNPDNRDLILNSVDKTADNMHVFLDLPAALSDSEVIAMIGSTSATDRYDRDQWIRGYLNVKSGNHVATIVTFEPSGNVSVQRFSGIATQTNIGAGFGDLNGDGFLRSGDLTGVGGFRQILNSGNTEFHAAADGNGDGLVDNLDLFALEQAIVSTTNDPRVYSAYEALLAERGDFDQSGSADVQDLRLIYQNLGSSDELYDLDVDGTVTGEDARLFVTALLRTVPGDFNLDGRVDVADYTFWRDGLGGTYLGDGDFDGDIDANDFTVWKSNFGFERVPFAPTQAVAVTGVPEPNCQTLTAILLLSAVAARRISPCK